MPDNKTIAALATPPGQGGVGIIRISGNLCQSIAQSILKTLPSPRYALYTPFYGSNDTIIDMGIALYFPAPHSFTGEDVLELQGHGGPVVLNMLLHDILQLGAYPARPGEFSERAFLNDKMDLAQAEAISDLISCHSEQAARSALRSLQGEFSEQIKAIIDALTHLRMYVESAIDFPEEEIDFLNDGMVSEKLANIHQRLEHTLSQAQQGYLLKEGMTIVIAGQPNAGKSSLLNALSGRESAIVTDIAGTTRDILREEINIDGMPLHIIDTAGLRESKDKVEQEGIKRAWDSIAQADCILLVIDDSKGIEEADKAIIAKLPDNLPITLIRNKADLSAKTPFFNDKKPYPEIILSAKYQQGMDFLRQHLKSIMGFHNIPEGTFLARKRHIIALEKGLSHVTESIKQLNLFVAGEIVAEELRLAQQVLGEITGQIDSDALLGKIFESFCIGK